MYNGPKPFGFAEKNIHKTVHAFFSGLFKLQALLDGVFESRPALFRSTSFSPSFLVTPC